MKTHRTMDEMVLGKPLGKSRDVSFRNKVYMAHKKAPLSSNASTLFGPQKYNYRWFLKPGIKYDLAVNEVVAQEVFRLFIPNQPKTRLLDPSEKSPDGYGVISKQVPWFHPLSSYSQDWLIEKIKLGKIVGLGEILVISLLVNEVDLKLDNLGLSVNRIIKIDGGCCLQQIQSDVDKLDCLVDEIDLQALPRVVNYKAYNWLDQHECAVETDKENRETNILYENMEPNFSAAMAESKLVRAEINKALFKVSMMPSDVLEAFVSQYADDKRHAKLIYDELVKRKNMLRDAAHKNASFCAYAASPQAEKDLAEYMRYLREFKTTSKNVLPVTISATGVNPRSFKISTR